MTVREQISKHGQNSIEGWGCHLFSSLARQPDQIYISQPPFMTAGQSHCSSNKDQSLVAQYTIARNHRSYLRTIQSHSSSLQPYCASRIRNVDSLPTDNNYSVKVHKCELSSCLRHWPSATNPITSQKHPCGLQHSKSQPHRGREVAILHSTQHQTPPSNHYHLLHEVR